MLAVDPALFGLFLISVAVLIITPGPVVSLLIAETLQHNSRFGIAVILGAHTASLFYLMLFLVGFDQILQKAGPWLDMVRLFGGVYLFYLAYQNWRAARAAPPPPDSIETPERSPLQAYKRAFFVGVTNPKTILFFAAFFPQFLSSDLPIRPQLLAMSIGFIGLGGSLDLVWVFTAHYSKRFLSNKNAHQILSQVSAGILAIGACSIFISVFF